MGGRAARLEKAGWRTDRISQATAAWHLLRLGAVEFDLMIGAKGFDDRIETLTRPWKQLTKPMDGDPALVFREALIGRLELLSLGFRL